MVILCQQRRAPLGACRRRAGFSFFGSERDRLEPRQLLDIDDDRDGGLFTPSPEENASACAEIRSGWTEETEISRRHFRLPKIKADGVVEQARAAAAERQRCAVTTG